MKKILKKQLLTIVIIIGVVLISIVGFKIVPQVMKSQVGKKDVNMVMTLEKIINVSELSTFTAVYNGIAQVMNEEKPEEIDYYVSYEAKVNAGIDFDKITIVVDDTQKKINITLPEVYITDINVDIASLDYIFLNDKANKSTSSQTAFKACEADVQTESEQQEDIIKLATQNAKNIVTALTRPIIEQLDAEYTLVIE